MRFDSVFILFFLSLATVALVNKLAIVWSLYWIYPWFDIPVHFLGGATVALGLGVLLQARPVPAWGHTFFASLATVLLVGILWEIFEWYFGLVDTIKYISDTVLDICMDLLGGALGYGMVKIFRKADM